MLACEQVSWSYEKNEALRDVRCAFAQEQLTMILGPNGSGKTTLLKLLSGTYKPQKGEVLLDGISLQKYPPKALAKKIAYVAQSAKIEYNFSVMDIVLMGRYAYLPFLRSETQDDYALAAEAMEQTGISHLAGRSILELSGGELQRVLLARALVQDCDYLLLDEPITGLDVKHQLDFLQLVNTLCVKRKITAICVLHDIELAYNFGQNILLLANGVTQGYGTPQQVLTAQAIEKVYGTKAEIFLRNGRTHIAFGG